MLPIMVALKLTGEHYIFYKQKRVGQCGKDFEVFKFATMLKNSPNLPGGVITMKNDPRILPFGNFLRDSKINELPQLINIFFGQMSFVGYRPLVRKSYEIYSDKIKQILYNFKPGLSGIGSIVLRNEEEILRNCGDIEFFYKNVVMPYKGELEIWYTKYISLSIYFKIILVTIICVLKPSSKLWRAFFKNLPLIPEKLENLL
jgi:lipopolysaccharide/colanic/teichoic acid biosynthesis glycosyltransferase